MQKQELLCWQSQRLYDISLDALLDFNDLKNEDVLIEDQLVFLTTQKKSGR